MIEPSIADQFGPYLRQRERVLWTGRPRQGLLFTSRDLFLVPFSLIWMAFVLNWEAEVLRRGGTPFMVIWGGLFVAFGLVITVGRFAIDAWARARTLYALTGERALVLRWANGVRLLSADLTTTLKLKRSSETRGTLEFGDGGSFTADGGPNWFGRPNDMSAWTPGLSSRVQFLGIDDVMTAYQVARPNRPAP